MEFFKPSLDLLQYFQEQYLSVTYWFSFKFQSETVWINAVKAILLELWLERIWESSTTRNFLDWSFWISSLEGFILVFFIKAIWGIFTAGYFPQLESLYNLSLEFNVCFFSLLLFLFLLFTHLWIYHLTISLFSLHRKKVRFWLLKQREKEKRGKLAMLFCRVYLEGLRDPVRRCLFFWIGICKVFPYNMLYSDKWSNASCIQTSSLFEMVGYSPFSLRTFYRQKA